ncbi:MAG: prolipoprotein diacylglyceryl transferase [Prevotella sp.]|nr:prolipoprotein diacylglyceryl transferase [Prevotella sp.]
MINLFNYIVWRPNLEAFHLGPITVRWYGLMWLIGLVLACFIVRHLFYEQGIAERTIKKNGKKEVENIFDPLIYYCFFGILIGARLGHCLFYQPDYFLTSGKHLVEMFLPIHFMADGGWKYTGYEGLASHGGTLGLIIALWLYVRYSKISIWIVLDNIAIATGTTACFIRLGNLMNSEIIGKVTDVPWAFIFERVDMFPRHPGQLYEAIAYAILFFIMWAIYKRSKKTGKPQVGTGWYFGFCLTYIFTFRFFIEYTKDVQEAFEEGMMFNMGQLLSIPFIIIGIWCMIRSGKKEF